MRLDELTPDITARLVEEDSQKRRKWGRARQCVSFAKLMNSILNVDVDNDVPSAVLPGFTFSIGPWFEKQLIADVVENSPYFRQFFITCWEDMKGIQSGIDSGMLLTYEQWKELNPYPATTKQ